MLYLNNLPSGKSPQKQPEDAHLPPELRRAGLMAHMAIPKGKCFGPFNGKIVSKEKPPDKMYFLVSEVSIKSLKLGHDVSRTVRGLSVLSS